MEELDLWQLFQSCSVHRPVMCACVRDVSIARVKSALSTHPGMRTEMGSMSFYLFFLKYEEVGHY